MKYGNARQSSVYRSGLMGRRSKIPVDSVELERKAIRFMSRKAAAYVVGGAGLELTIRANRKAFERYQIVPRIMRGAKSRHVGVELFGRKLPLPIILGPIGVLDLARQGSDLDAANAAADEGVCFVVSSQSSIPLEAIASSAKTGPRWFQLYWPANNDLLTSFVERAERAGYEAIVVTVDTTELGWRPRDLDLGYLPFARGRGIANYTSDPVFKQLVEMSNDAPSSRFPSVRALPAIIELVMNWPDGCQAALSNLGGAARTIRCFTNLFSRPELEWSDLSILRKKTKLPILLKGILHPGDALKALELGVDGIIVSNHGGRQVDGAISSLEALGRVVESVADRAPVLFDSGIRNGADIVKAIALGARAVLIGRPYVYGLAIAGQQGVREVIQNFAADLDLTLGLSGYKSLSELDPSSLAVDRG